MYNPELKRSYMETLATPSAKEKMAEVFSITSRFEMQYNKDLCQMNADELKNTLEWCTGVYTSSRRERMQQMRRYIKWCIDTDVEGACNAVLTINIDGVEAMAMRTVTSPTQLNNHINIVLPNNNVATVMDIYRTFLWLGFSGIDLDDAFKIKTDEIDFENMEIVHDGIHYPIYNESTASLYRCAKLNTLYKLTGKTKVYKEHLRAGGDLLLRGFSQPDHGNIRREIVRRTSRLYEDGVISRRVNYDDAWKSGVFYRAFMNEIAGVKPSFYDVVKRLADKLHGADNSKIKGDYIRKKRRELKNDYEIWKLTFA